MLCNNFGTVPGATRIPRSPDQCPAFPSRHRGTLRATAGAVALRMGFNKRRMEMDRNAEAEKIARARRMLDKQIVEDAERLVAEWNDRQTGRMPHLFSPSIGAALRAGKPWLWAECPGCRTIRDVDLRTVERHPDATVTSLIPALSCRSCSPNAPFCRLVKLAAMSIADDVYLERQMAGIAKG